MSSPTTVMMFRPRTDYSLLAVTYLDGVTGWVISPTEAHHRTNMAQFDGQVKTILIIPGDKFAGAPCPL